MGTEDRDINPYAPPEEGRTVEPSRVSRRVERANPYEAERRSVLLAILLTVVTCGFYPAIWYLQRGAFLEGIATRTKWSRALPSTMLGLHVFSVMLGFAFSSQSPPEPAAAALNQTVSVGAAVVSVITAFRVAAILREEFDRAERGLRISGVWTFFLGVYYLQYKINQAADTRGTRPRRRKKKKKPADDAQPAAETPG